MIYKLVLVILISSCFKIFNLNNCNGPLRFNDNCLNMVLKGVQVAQLEEEKLKMKQILKKKSNT